SAPHTGSPSLPSLRAPPAPPSTTLCPRRSFPVSKRRGLPLESRMQHDSHFVDTLSERFGGSLGRLIPIEEIETNPEQPRRSVGDLKELAASIEPQAALEPLLIPPLHVGLCPILAGATRARS